MTEEHSSVKFVLRTEDGGWIARHNGSIDSDGRVTVYVPNVERVRFAGHDWLRHQFTDVPRDALNGAIMCPVEWTVDTDV